MTGLLLLCLGTAYADEPEVDALEALTARVAALEQENAELRARVRALEDRLAGPAAPSVGDSRAASWRLVADNGARAYLRVGEEMYAPGSVAPGSYEVMLITQTGTVAAGTVRIDAGVETTVRCKTAARRCTAD